MPLDSWTRRVISADRARQLVGGGRRGAHVLGRGLRGAGGLAGQLGGGARGLGELAGDALELAGGGHHLVDDAADAGLEIIDEMAQLRLALLDGSRGCGGLLVAHALPLQRVVLEHGDGAGDLADLVVAVLAVDRDVALAVRDRGQRGRHRSERFSDAADDQHGEQHNQQRGDAGRDRHGLHRLRQHALVLGHGDADIEDADHLPGRVLHGIVGGHVVLAEQHRGALVGLALAQHGLAGMVGRELGADGAVAVFLLQVGGAADELVAGIVIDEQRGIAAGIGHLTIDDRVVLELRHLGDLGLGDRAVVDADLGLGERLGEGQCEGAQIDLDVAKGALVEFRRQRPVAGTDDEAGVHRDQYDRANDSLGSELKLERRHEFPHNITAMQKCLKLRHI